MKSAGSQALRRCSAGQQVIADECGVDRSLVSHWQNGKKKPGEPKRVILETKYGIPRKSWDELAKATPAPARSPTSSTAQRRSTHYELLSVLRPALLQAVDELVERGIDMTDSHDVRALRALHTALIDGAKADLAQHRSLIEHPLWSTVRDELLEVLRKHPDVRRDVEEYFRAKGEAFRSQIERDRDM